MSPAKPSPAALRAPAQPLVLQVDAEPETSAEVSAAFLCFVLVPSALFSFVLHVLLIVLLALMMIHHPSSLPANAFVASQGEVERLEDLFAETLASLPSEVTQSLEPITESTDASDFPDPLGDLLRAEALIESTPVDEAAMVNVVLEDFSDKTSPKPHLTKRLQESLPQNSLGDWRRNKTRGFNHEPSVTEKAVALSLKWIVEHQKADGSWNFEHRQACNGLCDHSGKLSDCTTGATALALLPLLGAGQTHKEGKYKLQVEKGLSYLVSRMRVHPETAGDFREGSMYAQGIAAIALCEAYAMSHDKKLIVPAQQSLNYIMYAQDPIGGGWRYQPRQPGDTSMVGWQLMAIKSGYLGYLKLNPQCVERATRFLDTVQSDGGAAYGYTESGNSPANSAVGLLSRMHLGWKQDNPALQRGIAALAKRGPVKGQFYYNYYATQVLRHNGGELWDKWDLANRELQLSTQEKEGHAAGSWYLPGDHGAEAGGRLYCTSLATMILEVYYRHLPIYKKSAVEEEFKL